MNTYTIRRIGTLCLFYITFIMLTSCNPEHKLASQQAEDCLEQAQTEFQFSWLRRYLDWVPKIKNVPQLLTSYQLPNAVFAN